MFINNLITANYAEMGSLKSTFSRITNQDSSTVMQMHTPGFPLGTIISPLYTPVYQLSKTFNHIISSYTPKNYRIAATSEFFQFV